jgi:hypothetical protein
VAYHASLKHHNPQHPCNKSIFLKIYHFSYTTSQFMKTAMQINTLIELLMELTSLGI